MVKRYDTFRAEVMMEDAGGQYVEYSDYQKLQSKLDKAISALDKIFCYEHIDSFSFKTASEVLCELKPENYLITDKKGASDE